MEKEVNSITYGLRLVLWAEAIQKRIPTIPDPNQARGYTAKLLEFYKRVFSKWFFIALEEGKIDPITLQPTVSHWDKLVVESDLDYFQRDNSRVKLLPPKGTRIDGVTQNIPPRALSAPNVVNEIIAANRVGMKRHLSFDNSPAREKSPFDDMVVRAAKTTIPLLSPNQTSRCSQLLTQSGVPRYEQQAWIEELQAIYKGLGGDNNFLSGPPPLLKGMIELFGSPFNTVDRYCGAFQMEQDKFASLGSAFHHQFLTGERYWVNPPFDEKMLADSMRYIEKQLEAPKSLVVIVIIPDWKGKYEAGELMGWCPYVRSVTKTNKHRHMFYNYSTARYQPACDCRIALLSNRDVEEEDISVFVREWEKIVKSS